MKISEIYDGPRNTTDPRSPDYRGVEHDDDSAVYHGSAFLRMNVPGSTGRGVDISTQFDVELTVVTAYSDSMGQEDPESAATVESAVCKSVTVDGVYMTGAAFLGKYFQGEFEDSYYLAEQAMVVARNEAGHPAPKGTKIPADIEIEFVA